MARSFGSRLCRGPKVIDFDLGVHLRPLMEPPPIEWRNDPQIWRWTRQNDLLSPAAHIDWHERQAIDPTLKMYSIWGVPPNESWVGVCGLTSINLLNRNAEFSLYIAPDHQRQGFAKLALKTLFYHGFKNMGLHSIWGETFENNPAQGLFRSIGMHEDGRRRQFYWKDGKFWDAILFSVLKDEFIKKHGDKSCFS